MEEEADKNDVVYSSGDDGGTPVMSERVSNLANNIYREFERMIQKYDQDVVSGLMPLMVSVLEQLDSAYGDNNEQLIELEVLSDDNEQLITQYEREKQLRKLAENKYLEIEDQIEAEKRDTQRDIDRLEHENRALEARLKGYQDHTERQEERMSEMKREYSALHERHAEMVHHYVEKIERAERKGPGLLAGDSPQRAAARQRTLSGGIPRSPVGTAPTGSVPGELPVEALKTPDMEITSPFKQMEDKNEMSLKEEQLAGVTIPGSGSPSARAVPGSPARTSAAHIASSTPEGQAVLVTGSPENIEAMSRGSRSSTESSGQNVETCNLMDVDNIPIMTAKDAERMMLPGASGSPDSSFSGISRTAATIVATTPELDAQAQAAEVVRRGNARRAAGRPISLDLETLPEGVSADSLFMELSNQEPDSIGDVDTGADITAMGRELEMVMKENKELLAAKNKLLTQKNDLLKRLEEVSSEKEVLKEELVSSKDTKGHMSTRVIEVEQELKRVKHEAEKANVALKEASMSAAHRKRFTRVEMARVLMERNQYKERLMELQEAVRWTEMIRASKERNLELQQKKKSSIWKFFSNLFGPSPKKPNPQTVSIRYNSPAQGDEQEASGANQPSNLAAPGGGGFGSENFDRQRLVERRERYRQVRAHLNTDPSEGRMQAYGWSLPAKYSSELAEGGKSLVSVPVPVYCRPLNLNDPGMKIWCAAGVDLSGGQTQDGGSAVGASVFYAGSCREDGGEQEAENGKAEAKESKPSMVWIGSSTHSCSKVTVVDANYPQNILDCFMICTSHLLCITAVPGACQADYDTDADSVTDNASDTSSTHRDQPKEPSEQASESGSDADFADPLGARSSAGAAKETRGPTLTDVSAGENDLSRDDSGQKLSSISSVLPTMWLGAQSGCVYVHSAVSQWRTCVHSVRLKDSVLSIVHVKGRVLVALADGTVAIFHRASDGQWNFNNYHLLDLGRPHHSIRCMSVVHDKVWCGYRNKIQVIHPRSMRVEKTFDAHPRRESQVRQLAWIGDGVWVSIRLDSTLRLYNAHTYHHLQDIDIEPYVSKMLGTGKLGFSFVRITSLNLTNDRLWVGTGNGVVLSVPLVAARPARDDQNAVTGSPGTGGPGGPVRVYSNESKDGEPPSVGASFMPYCSMVNAQLSFHGHRDSVKFFVAVPGSVKRVTSASKQSNSSQTPTSSPEKTKKMMLVLSGGEGYVDFRLGDGEETALEEQGGDLISVTAKSQSTNMRSHIMVWQVAVN